MRSVVPLLALLLVLTGTVPVASGAASPLAPDGVSALGDAESRTAVVSIGPTDPAVAESTRPAAVGATGLAAVDARATARRAGATIGAPLMELRVRLRPNGDARWIIETRYSLDSANETAAFRTFAAEYAAGNQSAGMDIELFERAARGASTISGRPMAIENESRNYDVEDGVGRLVLSFTWTNFLEQVGQGEYRLGDALRTTGGGTWLGSLEPQQRLVVETPPGYTLNATSFPLLQRNRSVIVQGPHDFGQNRLVVTYRQTQFAGQSIPWDLLIGGGVAFLAFVVLVGAVVLLRRDDPVGVGAITRDGPPAPTDGGTAVTEPAGGGSSVPGGAGARVDEFADGSEGDRDEDVDLDLLSDEERVEYLLEQNGGRMKQAHIVRDTGWSDAKVSQLLSAMAEAGRVDKLRLGRENLISLPDDEGDEK